LILTGVTFAQTDTYFWFVVPEVSSNASSNGDRPISLTLTAGSALSYVTIYQPANPSFTPIVVGVAANFSLKVDLTSFIDSLENKPANTILNRGLLIAATNPITAYFEVNGTGNGEIFSLKGKQALGNSFFIPSQRNYDNNSSVTPVPYNSFDIVAIENNTVVTIIPSSNITGHSAGTPFNITLNKGQTYSAVATSQTGVNHLYGSKVTSTKPIAITVKDDWVKPSFGTGTDLEGDQIVPLSVAGKNFVAVKGQLTTNDYVYIISTKNNTNVYVNGSSTPLVTLAAGALTAYSLSSAFAYIRTSEPAYLWHETGSGSDMAGTLLPEISCTGSSSISAFRTSSGSFHAILITTDANKGSFKVNGSYSIPSSSFASVTGFTNMVYAKVDLSSIVALGDTVKITNTTGLFQGAVLQSGSTGTKYSFLSGYSNSYIGPDIQLCSGSMLYLDGGPDKSSYLWNTSATSRMIPVTTSGTYWVKTTQGTCTMYDTITITPFPSPTASFNRTNDTIQCFNGNVFNFQNTSSIASGTMTYSWYFGDGTSATTTNASHSYSTSGTYTVTLVARSTEGCEHVTSRKVYVRNRPTVAYTINDTAQCLSGNSFLFTNGSSMLSTPLGGTIASYLWRFGDVTQSTLTSPLHSYTLQGTFNTTLTAITTFGCRDSISKSVIVSPSPVASISTIDTVQCLQANSFVFNSSSSTSQGYLSSQEWNFGDNSFDTGNSVTHTFTKDSTYKVKLVVTSSLGCKDSTRKTVYVLSTPKAKFVINDSSQCIDGNKFIFLNQSTSSPGSTLLWNFGDSTTSTSFGPSHTYTSLGVKYVKLIVTSGTCRDSVTRQVVVDIGPHANFSTNSIRQCLKGNSFLFTNTTTYTGSGFVNYFWKFGDGDTARAKDTGHVYRMYGTFDVKLFATTTSGCSDSVKQTMTVYRMPKAKFTRGPDSSQCFTGNSFKFVNKSSGGSGASLLWKFGDNSMSTDTMPTHSYSAPGVYEVTLVVTSANNCIDSVKSNVYVEAKPVSSFTINDSTQCLSGNQFNFTNTSTGSNIRFSDWNFGDTLHAGSTDAQHTYLNPGTYTVSLIVENGSGCSDTSSHNVIVYAMPKAMFSVNDTAKCTDLTPYQFTDLSTNPGTSLTWLWNFGDGKSTSGAQNPIRVYGLPGIYIVTLTITNNLGCIDSVKHSIVSAPHPLVSFINYDSMQCFDRNLFHFTNTTTVQFGSMSYLWKFGDGDTSTLKNPTHHYSVIDTFKVGLIATSNYGCKDSFYWHTYLRSGARPVAAFTVNDSTQCLLGNNYIFTNGSTISSGNIAREIWSFGDGDTSHKHNITHVYKVAGIKTAQLLVISDQDCIDSVIHTMTVDDRPKAAFTVNDSTQCLNNNRFVYTNKTTISTGTYSILWKFDDGTTDTAKVQTKKYPIVKTYLVKLIAQSNLGCTDSVTHQSIINPLPVSDFAITSDTVQCQKGNLFSFTDQSTMTGGSISMNLWRFGDGGYATSTATTSHSYTTAGYFTVKLINVTDNICYDTVQKTVHVIAGPSAKFVVNDSTQCFTGNNFVFTNNSTDASGPLTYLWKFGDGATSTSPNPSHSYATQGVYNVTLIATNSIGCIDSIRKSMSVFNKPTAGFTVNDSDQCLKANMFNFTNTTTPILPGINFLWDFGNGITSTATDPSYPYTSGGTYNVKLKTVTSQGCNDSITKKVTVFPSQFTAFSMNDSTQCVSGNSFSFTNGSSIPSGSLTYLWKFGDGNTSISTNTSNSYGGPGKYSVTLITTSNNNCIDSAMHDAYVDAGPKADFSFTDSSQCLTGNSYNFINATLIPGGTVITGYKWSFGDGNTSAATSPGHSYSTADSFVVKLVAMSLAGCNDSITKKAYVRPMPTADFSINSTPQQLPVNAFIYTNGSTVPYGNLTSLWDLGDGNSSVMTDPTHTYSAIGIYTVKLMVTSDFGCTDTISKQVEVIPGTTPGMTIDFIFTNACHGDSVVFTNKSTITAPDSFMNFFWEFGDTTQTIIRTNPSHIYKYPVTYTVKLKALSWGGLTDSISYNVTINPKPVLGFTFVPDTVAYTGNKITLTATGVFDQIIWSTGENTVSIMVDKTGKYWAKVSNSSGCTDSSDISVRFKEPVDFQAMTIFTPNGDGFNDFWKVDNMDKYQPCKVSIYNRWGDLMYSSEDYKNDWDGKYNGKVLPEGTYYFILESREGKIYKGAVNILK
jgi:gliding motility-associated-like protein